MNFLALKSTSKLLDNKLIRILLIYRTQLFISWVLLIGLLTLLPGKRIPDFIDWNFLSLDKFIHYTIFLILCFLGSLRFYNHAENLMRVIFISLIVSISYGALLEGLQTLVPDRGFDLSDLTANAIGSITGAFLFYRLQRRIFGDSRGE